MARENNSKRYPQANHQPRHKAQFRVAEAKERQADYDTLTLEQKIQMLDQRLGKDVGAVKQRARLAALIVKRDSAK